MSKAIASTSMMGRIIRRLKDGGVLREPVRNYVSVHLLPPRLPKLNGYVERAHRTHTEEFYEVTEGSFDIAELRGERLEWGRVCNGVRPHQALGY